MKRNMFILSLVILWFANSLCLADRQLDRPAILYILKTLTAQPHKTWIPAGTIVATHDEYRAPAVNDMTGEINLSNEYRMTTNVTLRFDGERFYWQIELISRTDIARPDSNYANNAPAEEFDLNANTNRVFAWDGQKYTTYYRPGNTAIVKDADKLNVPCVVNGPLTAGFIPWGYGNYTYEKLSAAAASAVETAIGCQKQIQLALNHSDGSQMTFLMDPDSDFAVLSHSVRKKDGSITVNTYGNFLQVGDRWIPMTIMLEHYKYSVSPQNLAASDLWNFTAINNNMPDQESFKVDYETDALVEYYTSLDAKPLIYRYFKAAPASNGVDTDLLLIDKLAIDAADSGRVQNCAAAAMKYVALKLGRNIANDQFARLQQAQDGSTSLYALKQFSQSLGLYCRAVKTDLQTLKGLADCQAILHIPERNHYVVLGNIDDAYVRTIDLTSQKFFDRFRIYEFGWEWSQQTALLVSAQPISVQGMAIDIDDAALQKIIGAGGYSCRKLLQRYNVFYCSESVGGTCGGTYREYFERWGCGIDSSGTCSSSMMVRYQSVPCIIDPHDPLTCTGTGEWIAHYMRACR
jgi:hypothetical protein